MFEIVEEDRSYKIYRLTCVANGKVYIGVTKKTINSRWSGHVSTFNTNSEKNLPLNRLQKAFRKHGIDAWTREQICGDLTRSEAFEEEIKQIETHGSYGRKGYNATAGGVGQGSVKWSEYSRMKLSASQKESWETRDYKPSEVTRKKMSDAKKQNSVRAIKIVFRGVAYNSLRAAERATGITLHRIKAELADPEYIHYPARSGYDREAKPYATKDKIFPSRTEAAEFYKVSVHNLASYLKRNDLEACKT